MTELAVKICGLTRVEDVTCAVDAGADWLGLNFWPRSKRAVAVEDARALAEAARRQRDAVRVVGVFVNPSDDELLAACESAALDYVQLHGDETPERCAAVAALVAAKPFKAIRLARREDAERVADYPGDLILVDAPSPEYGGSGETFDWSLAKIAKSAGRPLFLAGGLSPENVQSAVAAVSPFGVDVASGVESSPGIKDHERIRQFVARARGRE